MRLWPVSLLAWAAHGRMGGQQSRANCDFAPNNASVFQTPDVFQTPGAVTPGDGGSGAFGAFSAALQIRCKTSLSLPFAVGRRVGDSCACLQFLHTYAPLRRRTQGDFLLHTVWIGDCNSILELLIRSFIETQSDTQTLWVWLKGDVSKCFFKMRLDPKTNIVFKPLTDSKLSALCDGETEPRNCASWADLESRAKPPRIAHHSGSFQPKLGDVTFLSDQIRLLVLWRYGGTYVDSDIVFLRDLNPFLGIVRGRDFAYRWERQAHLNNAVIGFRAKSPNLLKVFNKARELRNASVDLFSGRTITEACDDLIAFPSTLFDPAWLASVHLHQPKYRWWPDRRGSLDAFWAEPRMETVFWPGAILYHAHLHSKDLADVHPMSHFSHMLQTLRSGRRKSEGLNYALSG